MKRKLWKRLIALGMVALMTVGLTACGNDSGNGSDGTSNGGGQPLCR